MVMADTNDSLLLLLLLSCRGDLTWAWSIPFLLQLLMAFTFDNKFKAMKAKVRCLSLSFRMPARAADVESVRRIITNYVVLLLLFVFDSVFVSFIICGI